MGTTPSFTPVYRKNDKNQKVKVGISFNGSIHLGINHPSELKVKAKVTTESKKPTAKRFVSGRKNRKQLEEYSQSKALYHLDKLKSLQQGSPISPTEIQVDLEAYCNDNCNFCSYRKEDGVNNTMLELINAKPGREYHNNKPIGKPTPSSSWDKQMAYKLPEEMVEAGIKAIEITGL